MKKAKTIIKLLNSECFMYVHTLKSSIFTVFSYILFSFKFSCDSCFLRDDSSELANFS